MSGDRSKDWARRLSSRDPLEMLRGTAWWRVLCEEHDQDPDDPDAFCTYPRTELEALVAEASTCVICGFPPTDDPNNPMDIPLKGGVAHRDCFHAADQ